MKVIKRALRACDAAEEIHENNGDLDVCSLKKDDYAALVIEGGLSGADGQELKGDERVGVLKGAVEAFLGQYDDDVPSVLLNLYPEYGQGAIAGPSTAGDNTTTVASSAAATEEASSDSDSDDELPVMQMAIALQRQGS